VKLDKRSSARSSSSKQAKSPSPPKQTKLKKAISDDSAGKLSKSKSQTKKEEIKE
jgi:hypothetical protein